jgi:hypothetical protein
MATSEFHAIGLRNKKEEFSGEMANGSLALSLSSTTLLVFLPGTTGARVVAPNLVATYYLLDRLRVP